MKLAASAGATFDNLGRSVAMSGSTVVAGADLDDVASNVDQGSAYVFQNGPAAQTTRSAPMMQ
jgi:hypothetical protein